MTLQEKIKLLELENEQLKSKLNNKNETILSLAAFDYELNFHRLILENIAEGINLVETKTGNIVYCNPAFEKMFGYEKNELLGKNSTIINANTKKSPEETVMEIISCLNLTGNWQGEIANVKKDGTIFYCDVSVSTFNHPKFGNIWISIHKDITKQKQIEQNYDEMSLLSQEIIENAQQGIIVYDKDLKYKVWNPFMEKITGLKASDVIGKYPLDLFPFLKENKIIDKLHEILKNGTSFQLEFPFKVPISNMEGWALDFSSPIINKEKEIIGILAIVVDITKQKKAEEFLLKANDRLIFLNELSSKILKVNNITDICQIVTLRLADILPDTIVLCNLIDAEKKEAKLEAIAGIQNNLLNKVIEISGFSFIGKTFKLIPSHDEYLRTGKLHLFENGLAEFSGTEVPIFASNAIEKLIGINKIYSIGVSRGQHLIASLQFFSFNHSSIKDKEFLETFVGQAGIVLQKKMIELKLVESEAKYKMLTDFSGDMIVMHHNSKKYYVNPTVEKILGYTQEEYLKYSRLDLLHPDDKEKMRKRIEDDFTNKKEKNYVSEYRRKHKDGHYVWLSAHTIIHPIDTDNVITIVNARDITPKKIIEQEIQKLSTVVKQSPTAIVITDTDGNIEYINPQFTKITGYTFEEATGKNPNILKTNHHSAYYYKQLWDTIKNGKTWKGNFYNKRKNGTYFWEETTIAPIFNDRNEIINFVALKQDITERKEIENKLKQQNEQLQELNATKDKFISILAHDLRAPFNALIGLSDLLIDEFDQYDKKTILDFITKINFTSKNTLTFLDNLLKWARVQRDGITLVPQKLDLLVVANECKLFVNESATVKKINIHIEIPVPTFVLADYDMLYTILRNLLTNAIKFTPIEGNVTLSVKSTQDYIEISISDTGIGMDDKTKNSLFKIGEMKSKKGTEGEKGTGFGLLLCKEFVEKHGGKIWAESQFGQGSHFKFTIPKS